MLAWRWYIELPIRSPLDERTVKVTITQHGCFSCESNDTHTASISYFEYVWLERR